MNGIRSENSDARANEGEPPLLPKKSPFFPGGFWTGRERLGRVWDGLKVQKI